MSIPCEHCGAILADDAQFCSQCGNKVKVLRCDCCGKPIPFDSQFCPLCGAPVTVHVKQAQSTPPPPVFQTQTHSNTEPSGNQATTSNTIPRNEKTKREPQPPASDTSEEQLLGILTCEYLNWMQAKLGVTVELQADQLSIRHRFGSHLKYSKDPINIAYKDIAGMQWRTHTSWFFITLFSLLIALTLYLPFSGKATIPWMLTLVVADALGIWRFFFDVFHYELIVAEKTGQNTKIPFESKQLLQQTAQDIRDRLVPPATPQQLESIIRKRTNYYVPQFERIAQGEPGKFNWAAFFLGPFFCFYRSGGTLFRTFFLSYYVLYCTITVAFIWMTTIFMKGDPIPLIPWLIICGIAELMMTIYGLVCMIHCGRQFNRRYYEYCQVQAALAEGRKKDTEGSVSKGILSFVGISLCVSVLMSCCGMYLSGAITNWMLMDLYDDTAQGIQWEEDVTNTPATLSDVEEKPLEEAPIQQEPTVTPDISVPASTDPSEEVPVMTYPSTPEVRPSVPVIPPRPTGYYLFPSDSQYITWYDLYGYTQEDVALIRNEIYARHGCTFNTASIRNYFLSQGWYHPVEGLNASNFDSSVFNDYEKENVDTILAYEREMGWR